ncbi:MAG: sigma-70 family RNA polymerase sigma factor [Candidatus Hydrogenedentales bacterium]
MVAIDVLLIERWSRVGDAEAFNELVRRHANMVYGTCLRVLRNGADAEEVSQECFLQLARDGGKIRSSVAGWLHALATHRSLNRIKSDARRRDREQQFAEDVQASQRVEWNALEAVVDEAIAELPEKLREVVVSHFLEQRSHEAVAADLGIPRRTVSFRIHKGVEQIRARLQKKGVRAESMALAGLLRGGAGEVAPSSLAASLGKLALAGNLPRAIVAASSGDGFLIAALKVFVAVSIIAVAGYSVHVAVRDGRVTWRAMMRPTSQTEQSVQAPKTPVSEPATLAEAGTPVPVSSEPVAPRDADEITDSSLNIAVSGAVYDENAQPVPWAKVLLIVATRRSQVYEATTDASGRYVFTDVRHTGRAHFVIARHGYLNDFKPLELSAGQVYKDQDFGIRPGLAVEGALLAVDGEPVPDAVVWAGEAWNEDNYAPENTVAFAAAVTDSAGRFDMGMDAKAVWAHVWVNSEVRGTDCFSRVALKEEGLRLQMKEKARIHGNVAWPDGAPAVGKAVVVLSRLSEPDTRTIRTDWRAPTEQREIVSEDGSYSISDLYPAMSHDVLIIENEEGKDATVSSPLAAPLKGLTFSPGEDVEKNFVVSQAARIVGRVLTEKSQRPVPGTMVWLAREGDTGFASPNRTDPDGAFEFKCAPGAYTLYTDALTDDYQAIVKERFGRSITVGAGEIVTQDLKVFEPVEIRLRILDHEGRPAKQAIVELGVVSPNGRRAGGSAPANMDAEGHVTLPVYQDVAEVWASAGKSHQGPRVETVHHTARLGDVLPEETLVLDATCTVKGVVVDVDGRPVSDRGVTIKATYEDGSEDRIGTGLNAAGEFNSLPGIAELRAGAATFEVTVDDVEASWRSEPMECLPEQEVDLGTIMIDVTKAGPQPPTRDEE